MNTSERQFTEMVRQNKTTIYTVCYMFTKDDDEIADLFQEALINLWKGFEGFEGRSDVKTWIYRVTLNTCISADRKKKRNKSVPLSIDPKILDDNDDDTRQVKMLRKRIARLQPFDRAIVLLWLENLSYEEIGAIVGITAKNVSVKLVRIKEQLKQMND